MMRWNSVSSTDSASSVRLGVSGEHRPLRMPRCKSACPYNLSKTVFQLLLDFRRGRYVVPHNKFVRCRLQLSRDAFPYCCRHLLPRRVDGNYLDVTRIHSVSLGEV